MSAHTLISVFTCALLVTYIVMPVIMRLAMWTGIIDHPDHRKVHRKPTPHLGGLGIFLGFAASSLLFLHSYGETWVILGCSLLLVTIGIIDDRYQLPASFKLLCQILVAGITAFSGITIDFLSHPFGGVIYLNSLSIPLTIFWIIALINIINLLDGADGLAAGVSGITAFVLFISGIQQPHYFSVIIALAILGSSLGFLRYNFFPAKIFMGDAGSMFLGYVLATTSIIGVLKSSISLPLAAPILVLAVPIIDTLTTIIRRLKNKRALFSPDKEHIHHKLLNIGLTQRQVALSIYGISSFLGALGILLSVSSGWQMISLLIASFITLSACVYFFVSDRPQHIIHKKISKSTSLR